eukprot:6180158-Pleurochrysis_carterae.AAC.2
MARFFSKHSFATFLRLADTAFALLMASACGAQENPRKTESAKERGRGAVRVITARSGGEASPEGDEVVLEAARLSVVQHVLSERHVHAMRRVRKDV